MSRRRAVALVLVVLVLVAGLVVVGPVKSVLALSPPTAWPYAAGAKGAVCNLMPDETSFSHNGTGVDRYANWDERPGSSWGFGVACQVNDAGAAPTLASSMIRVGHGDSLPGTAVYLQGIATQFGRAIATSYPSWCSDVMESTTTLFEHIGTSYQIRFDVDVWECSANSPPQSDRRIALPYRDGTDCNLNDGTAVVTGGVTGGIPTTCNQIDYATAPPGVVAMPSTWPAGGGPEIPHGGSCALRDVHVFDTNTGRELDPARLRENVWRTDRYYKIVAGWDGDPTVLRFVLSGRVFDLLPATDTHKTFPNDSEGDVYLTGSTPPAGDADLTVPGPAVLWRVKPQNEGQQVAAVTAITAGGDHCAQTAFSGTPGERQSIDECVGDESLELTDPGSWVRYGLNGLVCVFSFAFVPEQPLVGLVQAADDAAYGTIVGTGITATTTFVDAMGSFLDTIGSGCEGLSVNLGMGGGAGAGTVGNGCSAGSWWDLPGPMLVINLVLSAFVVVGAMRVMIGIIVSLFQAQNRWTVGEQGTLF